MTQDPAQSIGIRAKGTVDAVARNKNIILCSDGTGNSGGKGRGTNVWRLYNAIDRHGFRYNPKVREQVTFYDDGVGTETNKLVRVATGAVGFGLGRNIRELYEFLVKSYEPGDDVYLFGFSRGAYTVRSLAGMVCKCGLIDSNRYSSEKLSAAVSDAFKAYRKAWKKDNGAVVEFRDKHHPLDIKIRMIGVWDTVGAVGAPIVELRTLIDIFYPIKFHRTDLHPNVELGYHALAIDDERKSFHPELWNEDSDCREPGTIEQVWFAGAHSNVGGGYPKQGLASVTLDWMMTKAMDKPGRPGLFFEKKKLEAVRWEADCHDKLYDSRSGLAGYYRYDPRRIEKLCAANKCDPAKIHISVVERIAQGPFRYAPGNLPSNFEVVFTEDGSPWGDVETKALAELKRQIRIKTSENRKSLEDAAPWVSTRKAVHLAFVLATIGLLAFGASFRFEAPEPSGADSQVIDFISGVVGFLIPDSPERVIKFYASYFYDNLLQGVVFVGVLYLLFRLRRLAREKVAKKFVEFWDAVRPLPIARLYLRPRVDTPPTQSAQAS
ncbi:MAG: DUF2235 domain-containing protein [Minwuiales bacterium]|nr:DUF2235 domain-containing protein [Minwuiales bacterium]